MINITSSQLPFSFNTENRKIHFHNKSVFSVLVLRFLKAETSSVTGGKLLGSGPGTTTSHSRLLRECFMIGLDSLTYHFQITSGINNVTNFNFKKQKDHSRSGNKEMDKNGSMHLGKIVYSDDWEKQNHIF